ncbi:hypothetical protein RKE29_26375, partial [Streptomyces sp. B1866]|nr:hypothetical protein [Streptomyces sp. B1866]
GAPPAPGALMPVPGRAGDGPPGVLGGWALMAAGLVLAGPGLTHLCGRLLAAWRPGVLRLLAGRGLQREARRIGRPVGVLCAAACGAYVTWDLYGPGAGPAGERVTGPLTGLGAALVVLCAVCSLLTAAAEARAARERTTAALLRLGAPARLLRGAVALRAAALVTVLAPLTWAVAELTTLPLTP